MYTACIPSGWKRETLCMHKIVYVVSGIGMLDVSLGKIVALHLSEVQCQLTK